MLSFPRPRGSIVSFFHLLLSPHVDKKMLSGIARRGFATAKARPDKSYDVVIVGGGNKAERLKVKWNH